MKRIISLFLATILGAALCTNVLAVSYGDWEEPFAIPHENESPFDPAFEIEDYPAEQIDSLPNGIRLFAENVPETPEGINLNTLGTSRSEGPIASGILESPDQVASYTLEIDHDMFPKVILCFYRYFTPNDFNIEVAFDTHPNVAKLTTASEGSNPYKSKIFYTLSKTEGGTGTYYITITAPQPVTGYAFIVGTPDTFVDDFSGIDAFTTVAKNDPPKELEDIGMNQFMKGYQALLNGEGEWFHYIPDDDGETFITAGMPNWDHMAFDVYNLDTAELVYRTNERSDNVVKTHSDTFYDGYVQKNLDLEPGTNYLIKFYSTVPKPIDNQYDTYNIWMGRPLIELKKIDCISPICSISANTTTTFTFKLSGYPDSMRADINTIFRFTGDNKGTDYRITSCQITAPNGYTFSAPMGRKSGLSKIELDDYLNNPGNVPINGTWKITAKANQSISSLQFRPCLKNKSCTKKGSIV